MARVLGVTASEKGWIGLLLDGVNRRAWVAPRVDELVSTIEEGGPLAVVAVDVPIGLPDEGLRRADELARKAVGPLASSVQTAPVRSAVSGGMIGEVSDWVRTAQTRVVEVHPEVSFARLAGQPLTVEKTTWAGAERRRALLEGAGIDLVGDLGLSGTPVTVANVLDAGAAAWTALRVAYGMAFSLPSPPETFSDGHPAAIWV